MDSKTITREELARMFDHTLVRQDAKQEEFKKLCDEAKENHFAMVAINSSQVSYCKSLLYGTGIDVGAAISFPWGQTEIPVKVFETKYAIEQGADEIDYVINIGKLKEGNFDYIEREMQLIVSECRKGNVLVKVLFENCYLTRDEKIALINIANKIKPDFIKTSTGYGSGGATLDDVKLMRELAIPSIKIKASGGIRDWETAAKYIDLGVSRIGTSSAFKILKGYDEK